MDLFLCCPSSQSRPNFDVEHEVLLAHGQQNLSEKHNFQLVIQLERAGYRDAAHRSMHH